MDGLTLLALVGIVDPPRPAAKAAIAKAHDAGIQVRMITATIRSPPAAIAQELGIRGRAISGAQFGELSDEQAVRRSTTSASSPGSRRSRRSDSSTSSSARGTSWQ